MKLLVDISHIDYKMLRGQAMSSLNVLHGLDKMCDKSYELYVFCEKNLSEKVKEYCPSAHILYAPRIPLKGSTNGVCLALFYFISALYSEIVYPRIIKKTHPDAIIFMHGMISIANSYKNIFKIVNTQDASALTYVDSKSLKRRVWGHYCTWRYKLDFNRVNYVIALSNDDKSVFNKYLPQYKDKYYTIYVPIKIDSSMIYKTDCINNIVVLNYAYNHKNGITVIKAFEVIMNMIPHNLIMIGDKNIACERYIEERNLKHRVRLVGRISDTNKNDYLRAASLYVNASEYEGFGMTNVEAAVLSSKILLADLPINREVVGIIASYYNPPRDVNALANAMMKALNDDSNEISIEARICLVNKFSCETIANKYLSLVRNGVQNDKSTI